MGYTKAQIDHYTTLLVPDEWSEGWGTARNLITRTCLTQGLTPQEVYEKLTHARRVRTSGLVDGIVVTKTLQPA